MRPPESFVGQPVRSLQTMLRALARTDASQPDVIPDGIFGKNTQQALTYFQRSHSLPVTGVADAATWERLVTAYAPAQVQVSPAQPLQLILNPGEVLSAGSTSHNVYIVQVILKTLADVYGSLPAPALTGVLDAQTSEAVLSFQYLSALPQTGQVDKITWKHMALQYPLAVNHQQSQHRTRR